MSDLNPEANKLADTCAHWSTADISPRREQAEAHGTNCADAGECM
jgi:hypothetical protein